MDHRERQLGKRALGASETLTSFAGGINPDLFGERRFKLHPFPIDELAGEEKDEPARMRAGRLVRYPNAPHAGLVFFDRLSDCRPEHFNRLRSIAIDLTQNRQTIVGKVADRPLPAIEKPIEIVNHASDAVLLVW